MWWRKTQKPLRQQLTEARDKLRRQVEVLQSPATPAGIAGRPDNRATVEALEAEIRELSAALENLGPGDG